MFWIASYLPKPLRCLKVKGMRCEHGKYRASIDGDATAVTYLNHDYLARWSLPLAVCPGQWFIAGFGWSGGAIFAVSDGAFSNCYGPSVRQQQGPTVVTKNPPQAAGFLTPAVRRVSRKVLPLALSFLLKLSSRGMNRKDDRLVITGNASEQTDSQNGFEVLLRQTERGSFSFRCHRIILAPCIPCVNML